MTIQRQETTFIPNTPQGIAFADEYEARLKSQNCFRGRKEDTTYIIIMAGYTFMIKDGE